MSSERWATTLQLSYTAYPYLRDRYWGFYIQDDFRITSNFTLNIGVRYDINGYFKTRTGSDVQLLSVLPKSADRPEGQDGLLGRSRIPQRTATWRRPTKTASGRVSTSRGRRSRTARPIIRGGFDILYTNAGNSFNNVGQGIASGPQWQVFLTTATASIPNQCASLIWPVRGVSAQ